MDTLVGCLHPDSSDPAIILPGKRPRTISHRDLADQVANIRQALHTAGFHHGRKIAMVLADPYLLTLSFLAATLQTCIAAPLNHNFKSAEYEFYYHDFGADLVVLSEHDVTNSSQAYLAAKALGLPVAVCSIKHNHNGVNVDFSNERARASTDESIAELPPNPDRSHVALVLHTSGTTGRPKAVPLTHGNLAASINNIRKHYDFRPADRTSLIMPLFHIHGIVCALLTPLAVGSAVVFPPPPASGISPSFLRDAAEHKVTWYTATPTLHRLVLKLPKPTSEQRLEFRFIRSCSSPLPVELLRQLEEKFGCPVVEAYAMTEAAHQICSNPTTRGRREGSVGVATGVGVKIVSEQDVEVTAGEVGEICIQGANVMAGYIGNEEANKTSFVRIKGEKWLRTGDQGKLDENGFLVLTGRIKELINKGGEKLSPVEIDAVVSKHESVSEAVTFAMPDEMYGEDVALALVLKPDHELSEKDVKEWMRQRLAQMKVPRKVYFVAEIPKTSVGKVQRKLVAERMLAEGK